MSRPLYAALIALFILAACWYVRAEECSYTAPGYINQTRPPGTPANYPPADEPAYYFRGTNDALSYISCTMCHVLPEVPE